VQTMVPLVPGQKIHFRLALSNPNLRLEAQGHVAWVDSLGQAGVKFLDLPARSRRQLKDWLFTQLLAGAAVFFAANSMFVANSVTVSLGELQFSPARLPTIRMPGKTDSRALRGRSQQLAGISLFGVPLPLSCTAMSRLVDALILLCSVLLFNLVALALIRVLPPWPLMLAIMLAATFLFAAAYWCLFVGWVGATPGDQMARLVRSEAHARAETRPRFR